MNLVKTLKTYLTYMDLNGEFGETKKTQLTLQRLGGQRVHD